MALLGNPQDVLTTPYGYSGQMAPETAIAEQALNRRRLLANMLTQQGLQPQQGRMVGRFYVAPSPMQGGAGLAQVLAGTLGNRMIDSQQGDLMAKDRQMVADAIKEWKSRQAVQAPESAATSQAPPHAPDQPPPAPPPLPDGAGPGPMQNIGPRPQSLPDQHTGVSDFQARPDTLQFGQNPQGLSQEVTPGDMSTMVNSADPAKAQAQLGDQPPMQPPAQVAPVAPPAPMPQAGPRKTTMDDLAGLMTHQHPQVRAYGQFLAQQMQREQEHADQQSFQKDEKDTNRAFLASQNEQNRAVQREGISSKLDTMMMLGLITKDQKDAALAQQAQQAKMTNEIAKGNQEIARMNAQTQRLQIEQGKTPPGYRKTADGNLEAVPGGPADLKKQGIYNQDIGMLNSATANMDRLASSAHQILNHPGLKGITGLRGALPDVPGTDAANARALLQTMKSQIAFDVLQEMRNNSKTGGALGNVSDAEGKRLEANLAALDASQSPEQFKAQLQQILTYVEGAKSRMREAFNLKHGDAESKAKGEAQSAAPTQRAVKRTGMHNGKKVVEYSDGTIEYAP